MYLPQKEVIILKPTRAFLAFLGSQLPGINLPTLKSLQTNNTAYLINKQKDDEATLNEIEKHFVTMFKHEIYNAIGDCAKTNIEGTFLDFLCCFKFELHSQILLLDNSLTEGQQLIRIKPRAVFLNWLRETVDSESDLSTILDKVNLSHLTDNATVAVKHFKKINEEAEQFMSQYYSLFFESEMHRLCDSDYPRPEVNNFDDFNRYFSMTLHPQLIALH